MEELQRICASHGCTLERDVPLSAHTTFRIGGTADLWVEVTSTEALSALLQCCRRNGMPYFVLGRGSNILAEDAGFRGVILHLGNAFSEIRAEGNTLICQAGAGLGAAARMAASLSLTGMECLSGIPGTVGGALYMNAGAYGGEMKDIVTSCTYVDREGNIRTMTPEEMDLSYRHSVFEENGCVIAEVTMTLQPGDPAAIAEKTEQLMEQRRTKQPLEYPSAGSTFKRPAGSYASLLIDQCGLKGLSVGGAQVSEKHCGFVINTGDATCADVMALCSQVHDIVKERTGYELELEPVVLG
ncbi:MAG: UDP-N-acetylmuramate dehydrogenase [Ruminococcus sp.]|nr:UDP-N-acetylmuramate dehydrogenase [Ruminococcus sp.]